MNFKKDDCILLFMSYNKTNEILLRDLIKSNKKIRLAVDDLKNAKKNFLDIWEKFESVYEFNFNFPVENTIEKLKELSKIKNNVYPNYIIIISQLSPIKQIYNDEEVKNIISLDKINFRNNFSILKFFSERNNKFIFEPNKLIYVNIVNNNIEFEFRKKNLSLNKWIDFRKDFGLIYEYMLKLTGLNYYIIKSEEININSNGISVENLNLLINDILEDTINNNDKILKVNNNNLLFYKHKNYFPFFYEYRKFIEKMRIHLNKDKYNLNKNDLEISVADKVTFEFPKLLLKLGIVIKLGNILMRKLIH